MAFTQFTQDMDIIAALSDEPNDYDGLDAAALKAKFDEGGNKIKEYINTVLLAQLAGTSAAANLGITPITGLSATTVQTALAAIFASAKDKSIADGAITTAKLADTAVTGPKIAANAVDNTKLATDAVRIRATNQTVAITAWEADTTYEDFPYRAVAYTSTVDLTAFKPDVVFDLPTIQMGIVAPVAATGQITGTDNYAVYIYASEIPEGSITVPVIDLWR